MYIYLYIFLMSIITYFYLFFNVISCESFWMQKLCVKYTTLYSNWVCVCVCECMTVCVLKLGHGENKWKFTHNSSFFSLSSLSLSLSTPELWPGNVNGIQYKALAQLYSPLVTDWRERKKLRKRTFINLQKHKIENTRYWRYLWS